MIPEATVNTHLSRRSQVTVLSESNILQPSPKVVHSLTVAGVAEGKILDSFLFCFVFLTMKCGPRWG